MILKKQNRLLKPWGRPEVRNIVYEIETVEIRRLYEQLKGRYQGNTKTLRKKLAKQFNRRLRSIDYILYE
ncbi:MAG: hypothetical protein U5K69_30040 [Balneolaceae bacterium]|nr:hypothetical protein [Balneolaceae bacterium]